MSNSRLDKLLEMLEKQPRDPFLLYAVGFEYEAAGQDGLAMEYYSLILQHQPGYLPVYYQAGLLQANMGNSAGAIELLNKGIELAKLHKDKKTENELRMALEEME